MAAPAPAPLPVVQLIAAVMGDVRAVAKGDRNQQQGFNFRGIDAVMNAVGPALREHGVIVLPKVLSEEHSTVAVGSRGTQMGHVRVKVAYTFYGPAGDSVEGEVVAEAMDAGDKATSKAMSVALRTFLIQALCLPTDEPDPDQESYERASTQQARGHEAPRDEDEDRDWRRMRGDARASMDAEARQRQRPTAAIPRQQQAPIVSTPPATPIANPADAWAHTILTALRNGDAGRLRSGFRKASELRLLGIDMSSQVRGELAHLLGMEENRPEGSDTLADLFSYARAIAAKASHGADA